MKDQRVFVTGGAGFIGSHIVDSLVRANARVTVYDDLSSGFRENLPSGGRVKLVVGDILDYRKLARAMRGAQFVSHQAAQLEILKCVDDPAWDLRTNAVGTVNVLRAAKEAGVEKVVVASSACVYGQANFTPQPETHPTRPNWAYGVSKLAAEHYARLFAQDYGLRVTCLRYAITYGPREWYGRVVTMFLKRALEGKPLVVFGDGRQKRDFTFVSDTVRLHNLCLADRRSDGQVYNVSTGVGTTVNELAREVSALAGGLRVVRENVREGARSRIMPERVRLPAELKAMVLDPSLARRHLGWTPQVSLREGLRLELDWLRANRERWSKVHI